MSSKGEGSCKVDLRMFETLDHGESWQGWHKSEHQVSIEQIHMYEILEDGRIGTQRQKTQLW